MRHTSKRNAEAKAFNAALADFKAKGAEVFGISRVRAFLKSVQPQP